MSHNVTKINAKEPDRVSAITQSIQDLSDVSSSAPSPSDVLKYDSSSYMFIPASQAALEYMLIGQGETNDYSNSGASSISANDTMFLYDSSAINTISGSTISKVGATHWISSITLPAGRYHFLVNYRVSFSSSGEFEFALYDGTVYRSSRGVIGESLTNYNFPSTISSSVNLTGSTTIHIRCVSATNVDIVADQNNIVSEYSSIFIEKVQ